MTPIWLSGRLITALTIVCPLAASLPMAAHSTHSKPATGGYSFNSATTIHLRDHHAKLTRDLVVGDHYFYRAHVNAGQAITATATAILPPHYDPGPSPRTSRLAIQLYDSDRQPGSCGSDATAAIWRGLDTVTHGGPLTVRCTLGASATPVQTSGTYYVTVGIGNAQRTGAVLPLALTLTTEPGLAPTQSPSYSPGTPPSPHHNTAVTPSSTPKTAATAPSTRSTWPWAIAALAATTALTLAITSRRLRLRRHPRQ